MPFIVSLLIEYYRVISSKAIYKDIINSPEYKQFKKDNQAPKTRATQHTGKITFTISDTTLYSQEKYTTTLDEVIKYIRKSCGNKRIVYSELDSPFLEAFRMMHYPNLVILSAAKTSMKYLKTGLPKYVVPIEDLYSADNRVLIKFKTARMINTHIYTDLACNYYKVMPEFVRTAFDKIQSYLSTYSINESASYVYILDIIPEDVYDLDIIGTCKEVLPYMKLSQALQHVLYTYQSSNLLEFYILMKAKKIRPSFAYYQEMKEKVNKILNSI
jgi:hypothetical protein